MSLSPVVTPAFNAGPADATATSSTAVEAAQDDDGTEATMLVTPNSNPGLGAKTPIELWNLALTKYRALEQCEEDYSNAKARDGDEAAESADQARAVALGNAVSALQDMGRGKIPDRLRDFEHERSGEAFQEKAKGKLGKEKLVAHQLTHTQSNFLDAAFSRTFSFC